MEFYKTNGIIQDTGFVKPKIEKKQYKLGDGQFRGEILMPDGHGWMDYLPELEVQNQYFETMHCTVFNTLNPLEILAKKKFGEDWNKSERYTGVLAGLTPYGGSAHAVAEAIRKQGVIDQESLPWTPDLTSFWAYSSPRPMEEEYLNEGKKWLRQYAFGHDWTVSYGRSAFATFVNQVGQKLKIIDTTPNILMESLKYSPLGVSVKAWRFDRNGLAWKYRNEQDNHWTTLIDYVENKYWIIWDSYLKCMVKARWDYPFGFAKRYSLDKVSFVENDAKYITENYFGNNVKGDEKNTIYFIWNGEKRPYTNYSYDYLNICKKLEKDPISDLKVVAQDALDIIPEGRKMSWDRIKNLKTSYTLKEILKRI